MRRLRNGNGQATYWIGVKDDGTLEGIGREDFVASLRTLSEIARNNGATIISITLYKGFNGVIAQVNLKKDITHEEGELFQSFQGMFGDDEEELPETATVTDSISEPTEATSEHTSETATMKPTPIHHAQRVRADKKQPSPMHFAKREAYYFGGMAGLLLEEEEEEEVLSELGEKGDRMVSFLEGLKCSRYFDYPHESGHHKLIILECEYYTIA